MAEYIYSFNKKTNRDVLTQEIHDSPDITVAVYTIIIENDSVTKVYMKAPLSEPQQVALTSLIQAHVYVEPAVVIERPSLVTLIENERIPEEGIELTYRMYPVIFDIPSGDNSGLPYEFPVVFPCTVATLGATIDMGAHMIGDEMAYDAPSTILVGALSANVLLDETVGYINAESRSYIYKGMDVIINNTVQGRIYDWDGDYGFKLYGKFDANYAAGTPIYVRFRTVDKYLVTAAPLQLWISRDTDRAAIMPRNTPQKFLYWNNTGTAKKVQICFEFYT